MRSIRLNLSALRPIRLLVAVCICAFLVFSHAYPAFSAPVNPSSSKSAPEQGEAQLRSIEKEAQEAVLEDPYSRKETQTKANEGLNEIQGEADVNKMKTPEKAQADSVEDKLKKVLDKATGKG